MKATTRFATGISVLATGVSALALIASSTASASAHPVYRPYNRGATPIDPNTQLTHIGPYSPPYKAPPRIRSGTWTNVAGVPLSPGAFGPLLLTDGTVIMYAATFGSTTPWYKLTPDIKGKYTSGTWSSLAALPSGYAPQFFAEQVLPDGRVLIEGGEYNQGNSAWTNKGALYNPVSNSWTSVSPPSGWSTIGDAESIILANGTYLLANCCDSPGHAARASISGTTVTWTIENTISCGGNPCNDEQDFAALPGGRLFMVDVWNLPGNKDDYWLYAGSAGSWTLQGQTPDLLTTTSSRELGPAALTPIAGSQGTIVQIGAAPSTGANDIYDVATNTWKSGPIMLVGTTKYNGSDAPAATLPDGNVLVQGSPGTFSTPSHFWEFTYAPRRANFKNAQVNDPSGAASTSSFESNLIPLPTGQILWDQSQAGKIVAVYTPQGAPKAAWLPVVSSVSSSLARGSAGNAISGTNFNGFDLGGVYGDDAQAATNFPIVRITNNSTGDVCFGRSYSFSTMGVWTTGTTNAVFDVPNSCEAGASTLQVIVNGIASTGTAVTLT